MNPRALAAWVGAALLLILISNEPVHRAIVALAALNVVIALRRPDRSLRSLVIATTIAAAFSIALNLLLSHSGDHPVATLPGWLPGIAGPITLESAGFGAATALGLAGCLLAVAPLSLALDPHELIDALPAVLSRTATATASALNLVPGIGRSFVAVREAQRMRGWQGRGPGSWSEVLVPVALTAMEDSLQLAEAMDARAYSSGPRTHYAPAGWRRGDRLVLAVGLATVAAVICLRVAGLADDWSPFPTLHPPAPSAALIALSLGLVLPALTCRRHDSFA